VTAQERRRDIWRDFYLGLLCTALLIFGSVFLERQPAGKELLQTAYNLLQMRLAPSQSTDLPVTVVDSSSIRTAFVKRGTDTEEATTRLPLQQLITALTKYQPAAIGIDMDFSPDQYGYIMPDDPGFFQFCLDETTHGTPIVLGFQRSEGQPPDAWLGSKYYESLAANISIPRRDTWRLPQSIHVDRPITDCPTMSKALWQKTTQRPSREIKRWPSWAFQIFTQHKEEEFDSCNEYLVDYGALDRLEKTLQPGEIEKPADTQALDRRIRGKVILIGDANMDMAADLFVVAGRTEPVPGVFVHASGVYTLLHPPLLSELTLAGRVAVDSLLSFLVFGTIAAIRLTYSRTPEREVDTERLQGRLTFLVVCLGLLFGVVLVREVRILWVDFLFVTVALILHPTAHRSLHHTVKSVMKFRGRSKQEKKT
jgi:hypothetical protein